MKSVSTIAKVLLLPLVLGASMALATGCGGKAGGSSQPAAASSQSADAAAQVPADAIKVDLGEFHFSPSAINAKAGKVTFNLVNSGTVPHDLVISTPSGKQTSPQVEAGSQKVWQVDLQAGTYQAICDLPGHAEAGMKATVVVQ